MSDVPAGFGIIAGRGKENAQAAIAAAVAAGFDPAIVRTVREGYVVPDAALVAFHAAKDAAEEPVEEPKPAPKKKKSTQKAGETEPEPEAEAPAEAVEDEKEE